MTLPERKTPVHLPVRDDLNRAIIVFSTVCTQGRKPILARAEAHLLIREAWHQAHGWVVGRYTIMPDHIHLFCAPSEVAFPSLRSWTGYWKMLLSRRWPWPDEQPLWQKSFWDRQLRHGEHYGTKWQYVRENPVRAGLCACADEWPHQGELHELRWCG